MRSFKISLFKMPPFRIFLVSLVLVLVLAQAAFASSFGYSRIKLERQWIVTGALGTPIDFQGAISANNSNQRIISVTTNPRMVQEMRNGVLWLIYDGTPDTDRLVLSATVIADVSYDTHIVSDSPLQLSPRNSTNLTAPDPGIMSQANSLAKEESSLETIRDITDWVHKNMTYDLSYWGRSDSAQVAFHDRRGVCVEYTHLLISMARSLGFDTRYASGYIHTTDWQQHAWAEIFLPGYGWIPADATFGQVGIMDDTHFAVHYADDQSDTFDTLTSTSTSAGLASNDTPSVVLETPDAKGVSVSLSTDMRSYVTEITINNSRPEYVFGSYSFQVPQSYGADNYGILLLHPNQQVHLYNAINSSRFEPGYSYKIPISASFNDAALKSEMDVVGSSPDIGVGGNQNGQVQTPGGCPAAVVLLLACCMSAIRIRNNA